MKGARRTSALVERHEAHAVGFWDALAERGRVVEGRAIGHLLAERRFDHANQHTIAIFKPATAFAALSRSISHASA